MNPNEQKNQNKKEEGLQSIKIGELAQPKTRMTSLIMLIVMGLFLLVVFFLPDINNLIKKITTKATPVEKEPNQVFEDNNQDFFVVNEGSKIFIDNHRITKFKVNKVNSTLEFKITNYNNNKTSVDGKNWFIRMYDLDKKYLDFAKITGQLISKDEELNFRVPLKESAIETKYIKVGVLEEKDYPNVTLLTTSNNEQYLVCEKEGKEYSYYFKDNKLFKIMELYVGIYAEIDKANESGEGNVPLSKLVKETYELKNKDYQKYSIIDSSIDEFEDSFLFKAIINLEEGKLTLDDSKFFAKDTDPKKINFLMKSEGYECQ